MPSRVYELDIGFDNKPTFPPPEVKPESGGPFDVLGGVIDAAGMVAKIALTPQAAANDPVLMNRLQAAFRQENDVVNAIDLMTRPAYQDDPSFDLEKNLKDSGLWDKHRWNFIGVSSQPEFLDKAKRITQEKLDKELLASSGISGLVAMGLAGVISPVNLIPFVGPGVKGAKAIAVGAGYGLLGGLLQEVPLQFNQETRTLEESVGSVAMSTVLGGVLGGAVGWLNKPLKDIADDMAVPQYGTPIPPSRGAGVGADIAAPREGAGGMKPAVIGFDSKFGADQTKEFLGALSPVVRTIAQTAVAIDQWLMAQLSDAGLVLSGNQKGIATSVGGTAENRILTHQGKVYEMYKKLDDAYGRYMLGKAGKINPMEQAYANTLGQVFRRGKLSRQEFKIEVARAMRNGDQHEIPEVAEMASFTRQKVFDPLFEEAKRIGIYDNLKVTEDGNTEVLGDLSYLNRDYDLEKISIRRPDFVARLAKHYEEKLQADFQQRLSSLLEKIAADEEMLVDVNRPLDEVTRLREEFLEEIKAVDEARTSAEAYIEDAIADLRSMARDKNIPEQLRKDYKAKADMMEENAGQGLARRKEKKKAIQKRLRNLNRSYAIKTSQHAAKLERVGRLEELSLATLNRTVRLAQRALRNLESATDANFAKEITELKNKFARVAGEYDRAEERIVKMAGDETVMIDELLGPEARQQDRAGRLSDIAEELDTVESIDRVRLRELIQEGLDETLRKVNRINGRRYGRAQRLAEQAQTLDPKVVKKQIEDLTANALDRRARFIDTWQNNGATPGFKLQPGAKADFRAHAKEVANKITDKILGTNARLAGHDLIMEPRGAEYARTLDIPSAEIEEFLNNDIEHLVAQYVRTLAPDIEIRKKLGEYAPDFGRNMEFVRRNEEISAAQEALINKMKAEGKSADEIDRASKKFTKQVNDNKRDLEAIIERLRHNWGLPKNPLAFGTRLGRIFMNVNVLRYMGMVVNSSLPDIGRPIMKYGMLRAFKDGWVPYIKGLMQLKFTQRELALMGASIDMVMHTRAMAMADVGDIMVRGSKFEKAVEYATNKMGLVAAFDIWTTAMKQIAGTAANAQVLDDLKMLMEGKASKKSIERLAAGGINEDVAKVIWKELQKPGGSDIVNGVLWPNTEAWDNANGAVDAYRAIILREVNNMIVTPGVERPLMMDSGTPARMLFQFKSFAMSANSKTFLAGLQQRDMALVQGVTVSLALGALSYYIWANITGGKALEDLNNDLESGNYGRIVDEAINRSGVLGALGMGQDILSAIPMTAPHVTLGDERLSRQADNDFIDALGGPSLDLIARFARATPGLTEEGEAEFTRKNAHQLRLMAPLQNHFLLRHAYDAIEKVFPE